MLLCFHFIFDVWHRSFGLQSVRFLIAKCRLYLIVRLLLSLLGVLEHVTHVNVQFGPGQLILLLKQLLALPGDLFDRSDGF